MGKRALIARIRALVWAGLDIDSGPGKYRVLMREAG